MEEMMSFWDGEQCEYCGGRIVEKRVDLHRKINGKYVLTENVPAPFYSARNNLG
jgi:YgiT-type zinc finger domain-containing protein